MPLEQEAGTAVLLDHSLGHRDLVNGPSENSLRLTLGLAQFFSQFRMSPQLTAQQDPVKAELQQAENSPWAAFQVRSTPASCAMS
jgi:hypothetical protein